MNNLFPFDITDEYVKELIIPNTPDSLFDQSVIHNFLEDNKLKKLLTDESKITWDFNELEKQVKNKIPKEKYQWYDETTTVGNSTINNKNSFLNYELIPNYLNANKKVDFSHKINLWSKDLGLSTFKSKTPIFTCAYGAANLYSDKSDEIECAIGSIMNGVTYTIPSFTKYNIEIITDTINNKYPDTFLIYQLYLTNDNEINISLIERAKCARVSVIIVSIDAGAAHGGINMISSSSDITFSNNIAGNILSDPVFNYKCFMETGYVGTKDINILEKVKYLLKDNNIILIYNKKKAFSYARKVQIGGISMQNDLKDETHENYKCSIYNIVKICHSSVKLSKYNIENEKIFKPLPVVIKGIISIENALTSVDAGADGIYVSNHGGRFLYNSVAPINVLTNIRNSVKKINSNIGIWFDSGIRHGGDILIAYALGAEFVGIGRPVIYACALYGKKGVNAILKQLLFFFKQQCILCGINKLDNYESLKNIIKENTSNKYLNKYLKYKNKYLVRASIHHTK